MLWSPNTQLHYPFQNTALDYSGHARHGTINGSGVFATRPNAGRCLYFDGTGDYVATPSFGLSGTVVVFAAWAKTESLPSPLAQGIFCDGPVTTDGFIRCFRTASTNNLYWRYANPANTLSTATDFFLGYNSVWVFITVVCDYAGKKCYYYRNGVLFYTDAALSGTPVFPSPAKEKYVGTIDLINPYYLTDGYLQNVQLWTLATMPAAGQMLANVNRLMLGMNPIW